MSDLDASRGSVARLEAEVAAAELAITELKLGKGPHALAAERRGAGSGVARRALGQINTDLLRATLALDDLESALAAARDELAAVAVSEQLARDVALAGEIEVAAAALAEASGAVDAAMGVLAEVLAARAESAERLVGLLPGSLGGAALSHRIGNPGLLVRAARSAGLGSWLRLPHAEQHHCLPLADLGLPEVTEALRRLRGAGEREAA